ncbi:ABC transporter ATP-binding protein [uncultured Prochlorococcus sp.]|uniref:ABC transporter ATP-binding protein n=1 Tax=uncultured Prochlorococcus sp. TaxID=159733 RepID=UPI00258CD2BC|nr:ATP-binding cassette domain-containing protein [uncultured Prochlorococcus sp.]
MIFLENVSLSIPIFTNETRQFKKILVNSVTGGLLQRESAEITRINALNSVNCKIERGERVALIGHNGSGKTSFLKVISGIYFATSGILKKDMQVFPMINKSFLTSNELSGVVAAKAHYLMVKGSKKGFEEYLEEIKEFSGIGDFVYLPIKTYSQGMEARLLFTILTSFKHECLALDEGFGTGDNDFYEKAEIKMNSFLDEAGTLIFASHSEELLKRFCSRGLVFERGTIVFDGLLDDALNYYHEK